MQCVEIPFSIGKTINSRRSVRSFKPLPLERETLEKLSEFAKALPLPFPCGTQIRFFKTEPTRELYPSMRAPVDNVALISETDTVSLAKTGFAGELVILMAVSLGVSTCWFGHYRLAALERLMPHKGDPKVPADDSEGYGHSKGDDEGMRTICISPLGYFEGGGLRLMDRVTKSVFSSNRKEISELLEDPGEIGRLPEDMLYALDLARKAPSAANAQMWRFGFRDGFRTLRIAAPVGYRHFKWEHPDVDIGICASHAWLGLIERGHVPEVYVFKEEGRAVFSIHLS